jgi:hypothetical protein
MCWRTLAPRKLHLPRHQEIRMFKSEQLRGS